VSTCTARGTMEDAVCTCPADGWYEGMCRHEHREEAALCMHHGAKGTAFSGTLHGLLCERCHDHLVDPHDCPLVVRELARPAQAR